MIPDSVREREEGVESARERNQQRQKARKGQVSENIPLEITLYLVSPVCTRREVGKGGEDGRRRVDATRTTLSCHL